MQLNERGFTTTYALILMTVLIILGAGLLPAANNMLKMTIIDRNAEIAQAAAESGAKRAISELYTSINAETACKEWLKKSQPLFISQTDTPAPTYYVEKEIKNNQVVFTSTGQYNTTRKKIRVTVSYSDHKNYTFIYNQRLFAYAINQIQLDETPRVSYGSNFLSKKSISHHYGAEMLGFSFGKKILLYAPSKEDIKIDWFSLGFTGIIDNSGEFQHLAYTNDILPKDSGVFFAEHLFQNMDNLSEHTNLLKIGNTYFSSLYQGIDPGRYQVIGNLSITAGALTLNQPGNATIYIHGDLNITGGRIGFCADKLSADFGGNITPQYKNFLIIVDGNVNVDTVAGINFATVICHKNIKISNNVNIIGCLIAGHTSQRNDGTIDIVKDSSSVPYGNITVDGVTYVNLFYEPTSVLPFLDTISEIVTPPNKQVQFKVEKWENI